MYQIIRFAELVATQDHPANKEIIMLRPFDSSKFLQGKKAWLIKDGNEYPVTFISNLAPANLNGMYNWIGKVGDGVAADYLMIGQDGRGNTGHMLNMKGETVTVFGNVYKTPNGYRLGTHAHETAAIAIEKASESNLPVAAQGVSISFEH